jgi:hypothetical protein
MTRTTALALTTILLAACGAGEGYDEDWGTDDIPTGKADGLLDGAPILTFATVGRGYVEGEQLDVYGIDLRGGDKITTKMVVTEGDLSPHNTLYFGGSVYLRSATFQRTDASITKTYTIEDTGRHYIAVKAYRNVGAGRYTIQFTCTGGPCAGEPVIRVLSAEERGECIGKARVCSFAELPRWNGAIGPARSRTIFQGCLAAAQTDEDGVACDEACDDDPQARELCDAMVGDLPFYADATPACLAELDECMDSCLDESDGTPEEVAYSAEGVCWVNGFNGTCDGYARGHAKCGGSEYTEGSDEECYEMCESTIGAWLDDLDTICSESCP